MLGCWSLKGVKLNLEIVGCRGWKLGDGVFSLGFVVDFFGSWRVFGCWFLGLWLFYLVYIVVRGFFVGFMVFILL